MSTAKATHVCEHGQLQAAIKFLDRTRNELRSLRMVRVWKDRVEVFDINLDYFEVQQIGYESDDITPLLNHINTAFNPKTIHEPTKDDYKQFKTGRRRAWAEDRVM